jgi:pyruvate formate lyase activating enzyme
MKKAKLFKKEKKEVRCLACAHKCLISDGKTGICGVRKNINGELFLLVYGRVAAEHADPIEKKPLFRFLPGTKAYSIGTVGCNFKCEWCQNFDISQVARKGIIFGNERTPEQIVDEALESGCKSIAYTYNEPVIWIEFVKDIAKLAKKKGLKNVFVTNGYWSKESFDYLNKENLIDAMNIDLKAFDEKTHLKYCGAKLKPVLGMIKRACKAGIHVEITTLVIPGINDDEKQLKGIANFIAKLGKDIPWHVSRFFPMYKMKEKHFTDIETLNKAQDIGKKAGLNYVFLGNI